MPGRFSRVPGYSIMGDSPSTHTSPTLLGRLGRDELVARLEEEYDGELLDEALARVRLKVPPERWEVFRLTALDGLSGAEAAQRLGMKVATVYTTRSKVQKLVQDEVRRLAAS